MNTQTARDFYDAFDEDQKAQTKALIKSGLDRISAVRRVKAGQLGDVLREAQPDLDAAESNPSTLENVGAFTQGAARTAAMGLDDEAAGVLNAVVSPVELAKRANANGVGSAISGLYKEGRDDQRDANAAFDRFAPGATKGGETAYTVLSPLLPAPKAAAMAREAPSIGRAVLQGLKIGGLSGAASGFGEDEGDVVANTVTGAGKGAAFGAGLGLVGGLINPEARRNTLNAAEDAITAVRGTDKTKAAADLLEEVPLVGKPFKSARASTREVRQRYADAQAKRPMGPVEPVDPAISDDFQRPEVVDGEFARPAVGGRAASPQLSPPADDVTLRQQALDDLDGGMTAADMVPEPAAGEPMTADLPPQPPKRPFRGWSDEFDDAGMMFDPERGPEQFDNVRRKAASESLGPRSRKGTLQRMAEQMKEPSSAPSADQKMVDETAAYVATLSPPAQAQALAMLTNTFGPDVAKRVGAALAGAR